MSCSLVTVSCLSDVRKLCSLLNLNSDEDDGGTLLDDSFDWNWDENIGESPVLDQKSKRAPLWLNEAIISLSPAEDLLVVARKNVAVFLTRKWSSSLDLHSKGIYDVMWSGPLCTDEREFISSVLCVPLASQQRSSQGTPDWTCVVVGFTSGFIRIYVQSGVQILSQFLHDDAVVDVKLRTKLGIKRFLETGEQVEELLIFYKKAIVIIDGFSLYQSLRACRNQLAKAQASGVTEAVQPPPLAYRKWILQSQRETTNVANCGLVTPCLFDRLQAASFLGGFNASVKGSAPAYNHYLTSGSDPFLSAYEALEGVSPALLSDVALQVASKLTTAVFSKLTVASLTVASGWLGIGRTQLQSNENKNSEKKVVEKGTNLSVRFGLQDRRRHGLSIVLAPTKTLAVCTDDFGRVLLIDAFAGVVLRMWKGYRDAQCGWLLSEEEHNGFEEDSMSGQKGEQKRKALFLVIYAPRRGIVEIWLAEQGSRVGAFSVGKDCRLIYHGYSLLGRNQGHDDACKYAQSHQCYLVQSTGEFKVIQVPFHCALSVAHSLKARDAHLMKKLTSSLDKKIMTTEKPECQKDLCKTLLSIIQEIYVPASQMKAVQLIVSNGNVPSSFLNLFLREVAAFSSKSDTTEQKQDLEYEAGRHSLVIFCKRVLSLVDTYSKLVELSKTSVKLNPIADRKGDVLEAFSEMLHLSKSEAEIFFDSISRYMDKCLHHRPSRRRSNSISVADVLSVTDFLSCFDIPSHSEGIQDKAGRSKPHEWNHLKSSLSKEKLLVLGSVLFEDGLLGKIPISKLVLLFNGLNLPASQLLELAVKLMESELGAIILEWPSMKYFHSLVSSMSSLPGGPTEISNDGTMWWDTVRDILSCSAMTGPALVTALVCRSVAMEMSLAAQKLQEVGNDTELSKEGWEPVTVDMETWNLLVHRLDDLVALDCFVHTNHSLDDRCKRALYSRLVSEEDRKVLQLGGKKRPASVAFAASFKFNTLLSVQGILDNGHGAVAQIIASCLAQQGVPGPCLGKMRRLSNHGTNQTNKDMKQSNPNEDFPEEDDNEEIHVLQDIQALRERFPYSLDEDVLWAHCCWECIMQWKDDTEDVTSLFSALLHLSCIHCVVLKQGLGHMMWKTVYKDIVISFCNLMEKVGKAPKERLCRKTVGMTYSALEKFFGTAQKLLEVISEDSNFSSIYCPVFNEEITWQRTTKVQRSIEEQAIEEASPDPMMLQHFWSLVLTLRLSLIVNIRGFRPLSLYDAKEKQLLAMPLTSPFPTSSTVDDEVMELRHKFCSTVLSSLVTQQHSLNEDEERPCFLHLTEVIWRLATFFSLEDDTLRSHYAIALYAAGMDAIAYEATLLVHDKEAMARKLLEIAGARLMVTILESGDTMALTDAVSMLPTHITSWLQGQDSTILREMNTPFSHTLQLLIHIVGYLPTDSMERKFAQELIENLKLLKNA